MAGSNWLRCAAVSVANVLLVQVMRYNLLELLSDGKVRVLPVERLIAEGCVDRSGYVVTYYPVIGDYNQPL